MRNKNLHRNRDEDDRKKLWSTHCGGSKHTKEGCFKPLGYPEWWDDLQKKKAATKATASRTGGKAHLITADLPSSCDMSGNVKGCKGEEGDTVTGPKTEERREERETAATHREGSENFSHSLIYTTPTQTLTHKSPKTQTHQNHLVPQSHIQPGGNLKTKPFLFLNFGLNKEPTNISDPNYKISTSLLSRKTNSQRIFCPLTPPTEPISK